MVTAASKLHLGTLTKPSTVTQAHLEFVFPSSTSCSQTPESWGVLTHQWLLAYFPQTRPVSSLLDWEAKAQLNSWIVLRSRPAFTGYHCLFWT